MKLVYDITNITATKGLAVLVSKLAQPNMILFLKGELGVGKTAFTKFLAAALQVKKTITSPTFVILNQYETIYGFALVHIDAYRLSLNSNFYEYYDYLLNNFTVIEWPEKVTFTFLNEKQLTIEIKVINERRIATISDHNLTVQELQVFNQTIVT